MPFAAALSTQPVAAKAVEEACQEAFGRLSEPVDLALLFFSPHYGDEAEILAATARHCLSPRCLLACSGESIVGNDQEIEQGPALSLWLAHWSKPAQMSPFHLEVEPTPEGRSLLGWPDELTEADPRHSIILLLADPFSFPVDAFLHQVNQDYSGLRVMGGMASGGRGPGEVPLIQDSHIYPGGAVGVLLQGPLQVRSIVSQGCRPIGRPLVITKGQENIIMELGGQPPLAQLKHLWQELNSQERNLFQQGLHVGQVINEYQDKFQRGDFLVRNVVGLDQETGALAITDRIRLGQTVQFHVRDAATADEDLRALLQLDLLAHRTPPRGALLFTCNGRGRRFFGRPHHDALSIQSEIGPLPVAGFFAQGELGPVGGQNFIHGFTASVALFED
jgi:small ligand-binding sensory domain FIST